MRGREGGGSGETTSASVGASATSMRNWFLKLR